MFKIGQEVICVKPHSQGILTVGKHYTILDVSKQCCNYVVDVGIKSDDNYAEYTECSCGKNYFSGNIFWINPDKFAPIENDTWADDILNSVVKEMELVIIL